MDLSALGPRILAAVIIGGISAATSFASRHWIEALLRSKFSTYVSVVRGAWKGTFDQRWGVVSKVTIKLMLKSKLNIVYGYITYETTKLKFVGGFIQDRYPSLHYKNVVESKLQHGTIVLLLSGNNHRLTGDFVGIGPISEKIVVGTIDVTR